MRSRIGLGALLGLTTLGIFALAAPVSAAPPGSSVQNTQTLENAEIHVNSGGYSYYVGLNAQRTVGAETYAQVAYDVYVNHSNDQIAGCGGGFEVDPELLSGLEDPTTGSLGLEIQTDCVGTMQIDLSWTADGRTLKGNGHWRDPGYRCSSHSVITPVSLAGSFTLSGGPEVNPVSFDAGFGEIRIEETACHFTGSPGPA